MNELYTWFPYQNHHQCGEFQEETLVDRWVYEGNGKCEFESNLFSRKLPKDFSGCTMINVPEPVGPNSQLSYHILNTILGSITDSVVFKMSHPRIPDAILLDKECGHSYLPITSILHSNCRNSVCCQYRTYIHSLTGMCHT